MWTPSQQQTYLAHSVSLLPASLSQSTVRLSGHNATSLGGWGGGGSSNEITTCNCNKATQRSTITSILVCNNYSLDTSPESTTDSSITKVQGRLGPPLVTWLSLCCEISVKIMVCSVAPLSLLLLSRTLSCGGLSGSTGVIFTSCLALSTVVACS